MDVCLKYIGKIELGDEVIVSDPCYQPDQDYNLTVKNVESGTYYCFIREKEVSNYIDKGTHFRKSVLFAIHEDYKDDMEYVPFREKELVNVYDSEICNVYEAGSTSVDSGQAGIYDAIYYRTSKKNDEKLEKENGQRNSEKSWYWSQNCELTLDKSGYGIVESKGVVSTSGWGDGEYPCHVWRDGTSVIGFALDFQVENPDSTEPFAFIDETEGYLSLDEAIEAAERGASVPNADACEEQLATWLKELRDLRKILSIDISKSLNDNDTAFGSIEEAIQFFYEEEKATGEAGFKQLICWLERVKEAKNRIGKDNTLPDSV